MKHTMRTGMVLLSHGSLLCGAGQTLAEHAERLRQTEKYAAIEVGYLNFSEPPFEDAIERCLLAGVRRIVVAPYFLVDGKYVTETIPQRLQEARARFPNVKFVLARSLSFDPLLADAVVEMAARARPPERWRDDMLAAPRYCLAREQCPLHSTIVCPKSFPQVPSL